jgi:hypothetical protein
MARCYDEQSVNACRRLSGRRGQGKGGEMQTELREAPRVRTLLRGRIVFRGGHSTIDCLILDLSDGGARLKVRDWRGLSDRFELSIADGPMKPVEVCHRDLQVTGVRFLGRV